MLHTTNSRCNRSIELTWILMVLAVLAGCDQPTKAIPEKRPRPVIVQKLVERNPPHSALVSASVSSWKTEQIGFEVGGRVEWVLEPNEEIKGRVVDKDGNLIVEGTPIGQIETERYELQVEKSKAEKTREEQKLIAAEEELKSSIPAQIEAAKAKLELAEIEYERSKRLFQQNAGAKSDVDRDLANQKSSESELRQLKASKIAKIAEVESIKNTIRRLEKDVRDAERNREDCTLFSSLDGQIADVAVVPGSFVQAGSPVATVQMMRPIKVELEVSAKQSRRLQRTNRLPVTFSLPDGTPKTVQGYLYLVDPVADTLTRTFTVTLLVENDKLVMDRSENITATIKDMWKLNFPFLPGAKDGMLFAEVNAILRDEIGPYLWMVTNATSESRDQREKFLKVRKLRIELQDFKVPFLGNWIFQQVTVDDEDFDPALNVVVGELTVFSGSPNEWDGDTVFMDQSGQWMLRPGDLVKVDLSGPDAEPGFYISMDAIVRENEASFIFVVEERNGKTFAKKLSIEVLEDPTQQTTSSVRRITAASDFDLDGVYYITDGAHYLIDGEPIKSNQPMGTGE